MDISSQPVTYFSVAEPSFCNKMQTIKTGSFDAPVAPLIVLGCSYFRTDINLTKLIR
jgi:hypothetical protein